MTPTNDARRGPDHLRHALSTAQLGMIAIGGVVGAGLFVSTGSTIAAAGPAVLLTYLVVGAIVVCMMRILAELAVASPETGSFASYATRALGTWAGVTVSYVFAYKWMILLGFEATAAATIVRNWLPGVPAWTTAFVFLVVVLAVNLASVSFFGALEFWSALVKVVAVVAFIVLGLVAVAGLWPGVASPGLDNVTGQNFLPHGWGPVWQASTAVFLSYLGIEMVTIAAGEAREPRAAVNRAMRSVITRILVFFVGSVAVIVLLLPSGDKGVATAPFASVLASLGIPHAGVIVNVIILTALVSMCNSGIYSASRTMYAAAERGQLPKAMGRLNHRQVPLTAILMTFVGGLLMASLNYVLATDVVFKTLLASISTLGVVVYLFICATQVRTRARMRAAEVAALPVRMWGFPWLPVLVAAFILTIPINLALDASIRTSLLLSGAVTALALLSGVIVSARNRHAATTKPAQPAASVLEAPATTD